MVRTSAVLLLFFIALNAQSQDNYKRLWDALNSGNRKQATSLMQSALNDKASASDAFITNIFLQAYSGKEAQITDFSSSFYDKSTNPYPYIYALWFNEALLGDYGKKKFSRQVSLIDKIISDAKAPGTLVAASHYQKGLHYLFSNEMDKASDEYAKVGNIKNWQYVGPFENLSESGFYKEYGPLAHPESSATFTSSTNAPVKWFTPANEIQDGWNPVCFQINKRTAVSYAQTFITSADDKDVLVNVGATGSVKVWINDELVVSQYKERVTEMDAYTVKYKLKKGNSRILVQLGYTKTSYPNFSVRITDDNYNTVAGITGNNKYVPYNKVNSASAKYTLIPLFAEAFFQDKIAKDSSNYLNYLLLADVYMRNKKTLEARSIVETALQKAPDNFLLRMQLVEILNKQDNRTEMLEEVEKLKKADPESLLTMDITIKQDLQNERYEDVSAEIAKREQLYGADETTSADKLAILIHEKKYEELVKQAEKMYKDYPEATTLLPMMYSIKREIYKDNKGALKIYETYLKNNYDYETVKKYEDALVELGQTDKSIDVQEKLIKNFPYDPGLFYSMSLTYYNMKKYDKADDYIQKALALSPYNENYWQQIGDIKRENNQKSEAINAYNKSLMYDPDQYDVINKIRKLQGKSESYKLITETDIDAIVKNDKQDEAKSTDYGYYFIDDEKNVIMHAGGATEEYNLLIVRITNEKGIDKYKESSIGYGNSQELLIEKAEVIKKSGSKIDGERNDNQVVFTNLEVGDVLVFKYRLQNYVYGRFAKEFWDNYYFGGQLYEARVSYTLLMPQDQKLNYIFTATDLKPTISQVENFTKYTWEMLKPTPLKDEPLMPDNCDIGTILHLSTLSSWHDISSWYADIVNNTTEEDFEITSLYNKLFPVNNPKETQFSKARKIYNYIEKTVRYSSVSFRQSAYVPQRASLTLNTRLGDCKDLSNLFVTLCHMANIKCKMVLVDTRDNGEKDVLLPSIGFNHCIVKATLDNKDYYVELTDNDLPFTSLPNNLLGATILEIPSKDGDTTASSNIKYLMTDNRNKDVIKRTMNIKPVNGDLQVNVTTVKYGHFSSSVRSQFNNLDYDKQMKEMEKTISSSYKNNIKVDKVSFNNLDSLTDSVSYAYSYKVKNEVSEIGSLETFRIVYPDIVASLDNFSADTRTYPVEYMNYEDADRYETIINIEVPATQKFSELPANENLQFGKLHYTLNYRLVAPNKLVVSRQFVTDRKTLPAESYAGLKDFFEKIVKAEQKFIAYK